MSKKSLATNIKKDGSFYSKKQSVSRAYLLKWSSKIDWSDSGSFGSGSPPRLFKELRFKMMFLAAAEAGKLATELSASIYKKIK